MNRTWRRYLGGSVFACYYMLAEGKVGLSRKLHDDWVEVLPASETLPPRQ